MFSKFLKSFGANKKIKYTDNFYKDFFDNFGGKQFGEGLLNTIRLEDTGKWKEYLVDAFSRLEGKILPFGYTWDGIFFSIDIRDGKMIICDAGASQCFALPVSLKDFLNEYLSDRSADFLNAAEYRQWKSVNGPVPYGFCAGWRIPLFLNVIDDLENRELCDMEVYWGITGQIRQQVMGDDYGQDEG